MMKVMDPSPIRAPQSARGGLLGDLLDLSTYRAALYVLLSVPLGGTVAGLLTAAVVGGLLSLPVLVGALLLIGALWLVGALGNLQRVLAGILGLRFARPAAPAPQALLLWLGATLADPVTYRTLLFHVIQLPLGLLCWVVLGALLAVEVLGLGAPFWAMNSAVPIVWSEWTLRPGPLAVAGLMLAGAGAVLVSAGVLNLMGRMWTRLGVALLSLDAGEVARREVIALRRAAGRVALGDDLPATLTDLVAQARQASSAQAVALVGPDGTLRAQSPGPGDGREDLTGALPRLPAAGEASVAVLPGGAVLAALRVTLPASAGVDGGTLRARYAPGVRPSGEELAFLLSIADHAGTALHAAQLIERAGARAGELERARLARELHDSVAQALYGITLGAKTARATLERDPERTRQSLEYTIRLAEGGVSEMKALLFSLRPDALEEGGLVAALTQHAHALEARHGLNVQADLPAEPALTPDAQAAAYRVAQEALHNVVKHARARTVWLRVAQHGPVVTLEVRDDGRGFDPDAQGRGTLGQRSMRERAAGAGGTLTVRSAPGGGTQVVLTLPRLNPAETGAPLDRSGA
ncbi:sensor histidine kinase [Deinococcus taeanensis]|uniref:sensor histidine kinase n=1 Tax=Deinococcus taeanensis TaxID=2737050 RepID=UPI001CDCC5BA|nr:sensor histidine kinase [Deinococcus taeanensis]UBV43343.1 sensor histidine kinase [Deinococcus taeanensis]